MGWKGRNRVGASILALLLLTSGCGAGKSLGKLAAAEAGNVEHVASTKWVPRSLPPAELRVVPSAEVEAQARRFASRVGDLTFDDAVDVVTNACEMADIINASGSSGSAATYLRDKGRSGWVYAQRAKDLATELVNAKSDTDRAVILGAAAMCEAASQHRQG